MIFISITSIIIYFILILWTWYSLGFIEKSKKVIYIVIGIILMCFITSIVFQITQSGINYENEQMQKDIRNVLILIFTGINGIIVMPQIGKILDKINEDQIDKEKVIKRIILIIIIFFICLMFENGYMKDTQEGILKIYNSMK